MSISVDWQVDDFHKGVDKLNKRMKGGLNDGLFQAAGSALAASIMEVPHDEGALQASGSYDVTEEKGEPVGAVGYSTKYAVRLHEHPEYSFQKGRKGKYLEDPMRNNTTKFAQIIADNISKMM